MTNETATRDSLSEGPDFEKRRRGCDVCGEVFDTTCIDQVFYHGPERHERLAVLSAQSVGGGTMQR